MIPPTSPRYRDAIPDPEQTAGPRVIVWAANLVLAGAVAALAVLLAYLGHVWLAAGLGAVALAGAGWAVGRVR